MANELTLKQIFVDVDTMDRFKTLKRAADNTDGYYVVGDSTDLIFGTPEIKWDQVAFIKDASLIYTRGTYYGKCIPYNDYDSESNTYTIDNKGIKFIESHDDYSSSLLNGQSLFIGSNDGKNLGIVSNNTIGVGIGNGDINAGDATIMNILSMSPSIGTEDSMGFINEHYLGESHFSSELQSTKLKFTSDVIAEDGTERHGKAEIGFTGDNGNIFNKNDLYLRLTHPTTGKVSLYALRNDGLDNPTQPKYLATEEEWNIATFDTSAFQSGVISVAAPSGHIFDQLYVLIHWYGTAGVASNIYGGFYEGAVTDASKQVLRSNGTNKMGAAWFTANIINMDNTVAIAYGDAYMYNNNGSAVSLNNPANTHGVGRFSHSNDFTHFSIHNWPFSVTEGYCCIKYKLKKQ